MMTGRIAMATANYYPGPSPVRTGSAARGSGGQPLPEDVLLVDAAVLRRHQLDAAERLGALPSLGRAIRAAVVATMGSDPGLATFVNLHPHDLEDELLYDPASALSLRAGSVVLEITERASLDGLHDVRGRVQRLRELGFRIAIDDLGAGYAGLSSFSALAPDVVKLDMALVRGVHADPVKRKLVGSMAGVCKDLGIVVVAEGVEVAEERDVLTELGCDLLQGYFIGRPVERPARI